MVLDDGRYIASANALRREIDGQRDSAVEREFHAWSGYGVITSLRPSADLHANHAHLLDGVVHPIGEDNLLAHPNPILATGWPGFFQIGCAEWLAGQAL